MTTPPCIVRVLAEGSTWLKAEVGAHPGEDVLWRVGKSCAMGLGMLRQERSARKASCSQ